MQIFIDFSAENDRFGTFSFAKEPRDNFAFYLRLFSQIARKFSIFFHDYIYGNWCDDVRFTLDYDKIIYKCDFLTQNVFSQKK